MTNHLPLNEFNSVFLGNRKVSPLCDNKECNDEELEETTYHFLMKCKKYNNIRKIMIENVKKIYLKYNEEINENKILNNKSSNKYYKKRVNIKFIDNVNDENILKQYIFPDLAIDHSFRITIIKEVIDYVIRTERLNNFFKIKY